VQGRQVRGSGRLVSGGEGGVRGLREVDGGHVKASMLTSCADL
jgi:hypothetical protein